MKNFDPDEWELDGILPPKKNAGIFSHDTDAVEITVDVPSPDSSGKGKIPKREEIKSYTAEPLISYTPSFNSLFVKIDVWRWPSKYTFYERFKSDAEKYFNRTHDECYLIPFFSYVPQYVQLTYDQLNWYFWWRDNIRRKTYLRTDYSYILLYIYEIINLPELIPPIDGVKLLYEIWEAYHDVFPKLDKPAVEWICDYCIINQLEPPYNIISPKLMSVIFENASLKEFFIKNDSDSLFSLDLMSNYNWRDSKYITDDSYITFNEHINGAFKYTIKCLSERDSQTIFGPDTLIKTKTSRDAYSGSLCAYNIKRRIDIEYYSPIRSVGLRNFVTAIVKCAENGVRSMLGIKARFSVNDLSAEIKGYVSEYFAQFKAPPKKSDKKSEPIPEYEKYYEAESKGLSLERAYEIEQSSWQTTDSLVEAFDTENEHDIKIEPVPEQINENDEDNAENNIVISALKYLLDGDNTSFDRLAAENNMLPDTLAETVNEAVYDIVGDIVIENDSSGNGGFAVISDYITDVEEFINGGQRTSEST